MTREEYKHICYIIDQNTTTVAGLYEDHIEIDSRGIKKLKSDILNLLVNQNDSKTPKEAKQK